MNIPKNNDTISVRKLLQGIYGKRTLDGMRRSSDQFENDSGGYVWKQADDFVQVWFPNQDYSIKSSKIQDDCIGYRCVRKDENYTIFVYAFGDSKTVQLDGDYCHKLTKTTFAKDSIVLVLYLHIDKQKTENGKLIYEVQNYYGKTEAMDFWRVTTVQGRNILEFYPRKEVNDMLYRLIAAHNKKSIDTFEAIFTSDVYIDLIDGKGRIFNDGVFGRLAYLYENYGKMKLAYLRKDDVIFSSVPYLEGFGYFSFSITNDNDKVCAISEYPIDDNYEELWVTNVPVDDYPIDIVPQIMSAEFLSPETTQRFAVKLMFNNNEFKKYILPIQKQYDADEVVPFNGYSFTDKIWRNGRLVSLRQKNTNLTHRAFDNYGQGLDFINGYSIGKTQLYYDSVPFYEPVICSETVFENADFKIIKIAEWRDCSLYRVRENIGGGGQSKDLFMALLPGSQAFDYKGISTYANKYGSRATNLDFCYMEDFHDGLSKVAVNGVGYGYVDQDLQFAIAPKYRFAENFSEGYAVVVNVDGANLFVDKKGTEKALGSDYSGKKYKKICDCSDGMFRVSTMEGMGMLDFIIDGIGDGDFKYKLAYHHDEESNSGLWGYINTNGIEVIAPQYIFAFDFVDGIALVCKGKWEYKDQWDECKNTGGLWSEEMLWGIIDKEGNEVIPCIYDEIQLFQNDNFNKFALQYFMVHFGGYPNGKWGIVDRQGRMVDDSYFEDVDYTISKDGCFAYYLANKWSDDDVLMGIYSIPEKRILFTPQFLDVEFLDNGNFSVEVFDKALGRKVEKIIDRNGQPLFFSKYSSIYNTKEHNEVVIYEYTDNEWRSLHGLIDKEGNEILPCKYDTPWNGISFERQQIICRDKSDKKYGLIGFDETIIIPPIYYELRWVPKTDFLVAKVGEKDALLSGLLLIDGTEVLSAKYECIDIENDYILARGVDKNGTTIYKIEYSNKKTT